jgi:peptidoglycan/LPS O-acetylase OafA/YrhL
LTDHRSDIDGLRALAVVPVVLYHASIPGFSGGFTGVDVFFVISGFLITKMIADDLGRGHFSLSDFYARRVRRIVPALAAMLAAVTLFALMTFTPQEMQRYGHALAAAAFFSANIYFWRTENYFIAEPEPSPLLHTWSLAVEEQFYIFWPLGLMLIFALGLRRYLPALAIIGLFAAFAAALILVRLNPQFAFYMLPGRAWELLLGAVLALGAVPALKARWTREIAAALGVAAIMASVVILDNRTETPGWWLLLPCLGTALVIHAGSSGTSLAGRLLGFAPLVWIGLISYSLYLWHWPMLVLPQLVLARDLSAVEIAFAIGLSVLAAALSWRFVEKPFRRRSVSEPKAQRHFLVGGAATLSALLLVGVAISQFGGLLWRASPQAKLADDAVIHDTAPLCLARERASGQETELPPLKECVFGAEGDEPVSVLWGDSHANHLRPALEPWAKERGVAIRQVTKALCPPLLGVAPAVAPRNMREDCKRFNAQTLEWILATPTIRQVVLSARWPIYLGRSWPRHGVTPVLTSGETVPQNATLALAAFEASLGETLKALSAKGISVVVLAPLPDLYQGGGKCVGRSIHLGWDPQRCAASTADTAARMQPITDAIQALAARYPGVTVIEQAPLFCEAKHCPPFEDGVVLFRDDNHVTPAGAKRIVDKLPVP